MAKKGVGRSNRTPWKHKLLNKIVGREVGVLSYTAHRLYQMVDLCAGHGLEEDSSPRLFIKHAEALAQTKRGNPLVSLVERDKSTYDRLEFLVEFNWSEHEFIELWSGSSFDIDPKDLWESEPDYAFILNDPNSMDEWALPEELFLAAPKLTTTLSTMGCNASGVKRVDRDKREVWFENVNGLLDSLPDHHDALLVSLHGDKHQWAYLITGPGIWFRKGVYQKDVNKSFEDWEPGIDMYQMKRERSQFRRLLDKLIFTKKELGETK